MCLKTNELKYHNTLFIKCNTRFLGSHINILDSYYDYQLNDQYCIINTSLDVYVDHTLFINKIRNFFSHLI